jgi:hypothetical protein
MDEHTILILGNSFIAEGIARMLGDVQQLRVMSASTVEMALATLESHAADLLIIIGATDETIVRYLAVLARYPSLPIIRRDIGTTKAQIISSRSIDARLDKILAAIALLPKHDEYTLCQYSMVV